ncbi:MAG: CorA family divalent cation transporter [Desulfitobacteriaceae bacterium]
MEKFYVYPDGLAEEAVDTNILKQPGFWLTVMSLTEWDGLSSILQPGGPTTVLEWLKGLRPEAGVKQARKNEGFLGILPRTERLGPGLIYVCYRDIEGHGTESPIRFFITPTGFVLIEWNGMTREHITGWAQRGLLPGPMELAEVLGSRVLFHHQELLEKLEDEMDYIEEGILKAPKQWQQSQIMTMHKRVIGLKKSLNAHQSVFTRLTGQAKTEDRRDWEELVQDTQRELDNIRQTHELVESLREAYQTALDNRANDIMKLLSLLATVLLPINLLTSFFGMNFENMPLIHWSYGIIIFYVMSLVIIGVSLWFLRKRKWQK